LPNALPQKSTELATLDGEEICDTGECSLARRENAPPLKRRTLYAPPREVSAAIATARAATGVDFGYLVKAAYLESSFNPLLEAQTSSATGLFQFVEQTWFYMMREHGADLGLSELAEAVEIGEGGRYAVVDDEMREHLLWLRYDAGLSAVLAGAFTRRNADALALMLGREADPAELYLAHVLGATGAATLIRLANESPDADACKEFARAARANRTIFYDGKRPRSAAEVHDILTAKYFDIPVFPDDPAHVLEASSEDAGANSPLRYLGDHELIHAMR
jgi:hypothetical protein